MHFGLSAWDVVPVLGPYRGCALGMGVGAKNGPDRAVEFALPCVGFGAGFGIARHTSLIKLCWGSLDAICAPSVSLEWYLRL